MKILSTHREIFILQFSFDLTEFGGTATVVFHLFFHYNTCKVHRGAFVISVDNVDGDSDKMLEGNFSTLPERLLEVNIKSKIQNMSRKKV